MSFEQLKGGSNINFKLEFDNHSKLFLKHNPKSIHKTLYGDTLERELKINTYLYNEYKLTPKPIVYDKDESVIITEFIEGRTPNVKDKDFFRTLTLIGNSLNSFRTTPIEILRYLNTGTRTCPRVFYDKVLKPSVAKYTKNLLQEGSSTLFQFLEEITTIIADRLKYEPKNDCFIDWERYSGDQKSVPHGLLHNDLALRNIILTNNPMRPICFIDWEYADFGDIAFDLAYLQSENQILPDQIRIISSVGHLSNYIHQRTVRYIKIFLPMLELINCYWTIDHIASMITPGQKVRLRSPYTLSENLDFISNKLKRLVRLSNMNSTKETETDLLNEIQFALRIFERQLTS